MITAATQWILALLESHGAVAVFVGVIIESIIVPIPSPLIIMGAGAILIAPGLSWSAALPAIMTKIVLPGAVASTLGAYFAYAIAYWGGKPLIDRFDRFLGFRWNDVLKMEKRLEGRFALMIFTLRALPIVPLSLISAAAGVLRLPVVSFSIWTFVGSLPRCLLLGCLGYLTRDTYEGFAGRINSIESLVSAGIVLGVFAVIIWLRSHMRRMA
ncbi:MAG: VTT domain-containing protein [Elusimicrobiota bacterium]